MKAAVFYGPNDLRIVERPIPVISDGELLLKVGACAICGSDLRTFRFGARNITGPVVTGHELAGGIVEVGKAVSGFRAGDRVAVAPAIPCCECPYCRQGIETMCNRLRSIGYEYDGAFAEYMVVPQAAIRAGCVNAAPDNLSFDEASLAEPLACAINGQELLDVRPGDKVVILGAGPMGCMHADLAKIRGARQVILADIQERRLQLAKGFDADLLLNASEEGFEAQAFAATGGVGASVVIVAAPSGRAQEQALRLAAKRGRVSFFGGLPKNNPLISLDANLVHYRELFVMGAYGSKPQHNRTALELLSSGRINAAALIGLTIPLERIHEGFEAVAEGRVLKVVVRPGGE